MYSADGQLINTVSQIRNKHERIREVDVLRGLAIIFMVIGHSFIVHPINIQSVPWCSQFCHWIYTFHMELFFLLAGCVYHCSSYRKYINKKIDRLIVPYLFFGFISLLLHSVELDSVNKHYGFGYGLVKLLTQGGSYWFLYALFVLYLVYPLIERVCKKPWMEAVVALGCVMLKEWINVPGIFELSKVVYYLPYFIIGRCLVKLLKSEKKNDHWLNIGLLVVSLTVFIVFDRLWEMYPSIFTIKYVRAMAMILALYVLVHYFLQWVNRGSRFGGLTERFLDNCSKYSLQLYLFNGFILVGVRTVVVSIMHIYNPIIGTIRNYQKNNIKI